MAKRVNIDLPRGTVDETGHAYGYLTVREHAGVDQTSGKDIDRGHALWLCDCECGQEGCLGQVKARGSKLRRGSVTSCGRGRANKDIRQAARLKVPAKLRAEIASMGGDARKVAATAKRPSGK